MLYLATDLISTVGQETFLEGVNVRQARVERHAKLAQLRAQNVLTDELISGDLLDAWPELSRPREARADAWSARTCGAEPRARARAWQAAARGAHPDHAPWRPGARIEANNRAV